MSPLRSRDEEPEVVSEEAEVPEPDVEEAAPEEDVADDESVEDDADGEVVEEAADAPAEDAAPAVKAPTVPREAIAPTDPDIAAQAASHQPERREGVWEEGGTRTYSDPSTVPDDVEPAEEGEQVEPRTFTSRDPVPEE